MNIANYRVLVWKDNGSHIPRAWAHTGSKRTIKQCFRNAVAVANKRGWRRVVAITGHYLTGDTIAKWRASD